MLPHSCHVYKPVKCYAMGASQIKQHGPVKCYAMGASQIKQHGPVKHAKMLLTYLPAVDMMTMVLTPYMVFLRLMAVWGSEEVVQ